MGSFSVQRAKNIIKMKSFRREAVEWRNNGDGVCLPLSAASRQRFVIFRNQTLSLVFHSAFSLHRNGRQWSPKVGCSSDQSDVFFKKISFFRLFERTEQLDSSRAWSYQGDMAYFVSTYFKGEILMSTPTRDTAVSVSESTFLRDNMVCHLDTVTYVSAEHGEKCANPTLRPNPRTVPSPLRNANPSRRSSFPRNSATLSKRLSSPQATTFSLHSNNL